MAAFIGPLIGAGVGIFNGIQQRNAQKRAATRLADAAGVGDKLVGDANSKAQDWGWEGLNKAIDQYGSQVTAGQDRIALAGQGAQQGVAKGTQEANSRLQGVLDQGQQVYNTAGDMYKTNRAGITDAQGKLSPYQTAGATGANRLNDLLTNPQGALENTPGYKFALEQGLKGVRQNSTVGGGLQGGGTLKALTQFGQGLASQTYQDAINNSLKASGVGLDASQQNFAGEGLNLQNSGQYQNAGNAFMDTNREVGGAQASNILNNAVYSGNVGRDVAGKQTDIGVDFGRDIGQQTIDTFTRAGQREASSADQRARLGLAGAGASAEGILGSANATTDIFNNVGKGITSLTDIFAKKNRTSSSGLNV